MTISEVEILRARVKLLEEAHTECNSALRSAMSVTEREGAETNWEPLRAKLRASLDLSHEVMAFISKALPQEGKRK